MIIHLITTLLWLALALGSVALMAGLYVQPIFTANALARRKGLTLGWVAPVVTGILGLTVGALILHGNQDLLVGHGNVLRILFVSLIGIVGGWLGVLALVPFLSKRDDVYPDGRTVGREVLLQLPRAILAASYFIAIVIAMGFLVLPIIAIFVHVGPLHLLHQFSNPVVTDALIVTIYTSIVAQALIFLLGTPTAYFIASRQFRGRSFVVTLVELPIVLPPAVAGIGLIVAFGRFGLLTKHWEWLGGKLSFTEFAVVLAIILVAGPFYIRQGIAAFETVDANLVNASRTLGAGPLKTFFRVTMPLASSGLAAGAAICIARGLGEFGATIMFAGSLQHTTQTLPLAVYAVFETQTGFDIALAISALLVVLSLAILLSLKLPILWRSSPQTSLSPFGRSTSR